MWGFRQVFLGCPQAMVYPGFMNEQPTDQWVYLVRRILAVLVILLLVALLIPHAYQALVGLRGETGLGVQEPSDMGDSDNNGSYDEGASNGVASSVADDVAKQDEDASDSLSSSGQTGVSDGATTASRGRETSEDSAWQKATKPILILPEWPTSPMRFL
jgi:hypothetical protein